MQFKAKIVLIDDDQDTLNLLSRFFASHGYETHVYKDALIAYEELSNARMNCDVIVTDLSLPGISGIEFTKQMKEAGNEIPIILITANRKVEVAIEAISAGAYDFVLKPLHFPQLLVSIERALYLKRLLKDNQTLKAVVKLQEEPLGVEGVIGKSAGIKHAIDLARRVSSSSANVLLSGESGTGKEVIAKAIHNLGSRRKSPFMAINCAAIPENLLESELFGHAKGAFTGASDKKIGIFEEADSGTLFLDEIGDLNLALQAKLLRVLQERKIRRVGENVYRPVKARIISATHKNLREAIELKTFREDLFYRLNVIPIWIPPLRERKEDIIPLAEFFLKKYSALNNLRNRQFSKSCLEALSNHQWQGNVRELENSIERALVLSDSDIIHASDVISIDESDTRGHGIHAHFDYSKVEGSVILSMEELTNKYVRYVLELNHGLKEKTAKDLNIDRKTLYRRLRAIERPLN
ncbi:MAG TPA: sigma-54 dependent transcriptional regulator [Pseudobdellovibrionaceae bacterium]|jgi:DNA-binding NtrC family response regulator